MNKIPMRNARGRVIEVDEALVATAEARGLVPVAPENKAAAPVEEVKEQGEPEAPAPAKPAKKGK